MPLNIELDQSGYASLKLIVLNIHQFENDISMAASAAQAIRSADPDIVCLQEFGLYYKWPNTQAVAEDFAKQIGFPYFDFSPQKDNIFGVAVFSKFPIHSVDNIFQLHSHTNEAKSYVILKDSDTINLINVHLQSFNLRRFRDENQPSPTEVLKLQKEQIIKVLSQADPRKTIICGDFNFLPHSYHYRSMTKNGFVDLQLKVGQAWKPTYPLLMSRLDYIFVHPKTKVVSFERINIEGSDHAALSTEFGL